MAYKGVTKRVGVHLCVAKEIDQKLWDGTFDWQSYVDFLAGKEYEPPVTFARNEFAKDFEQLIDDDAKEASIYSDRGYQYVLWARKITAVAETRFTKFEDFKERESAAAAEH